MATPAPPAEVPVPLQEPSDPLPPLPGAPEDAPSPPRTQPPRAQPQAPARPPPPVHPKPEQAEGSSPFQQARRQLYILFEKPEETKMGGRLSIFVFVLIIISILAFILETEGAVKDAIDKRVWEGIEHICSLTFTIELVVRFAVCDVEGTQTMTGFVIAPMNLCDAAAIVPYWLEIILRGGGDGLASLRVLRVIRLSRVLRLVKAAKSFRGLQIMAEGLVRAREPLVLLFILIALGMVLFASLMYYAERKVVSGGEMVWPSIPETFWWALVTLTTVGYGDVGPSTPAGKLVACLTQLVGVPLIALCMAIIVREFEAVFLQYERIEREEAEARKKEEEAKAEAKKGWGKMKGKMVLQQAGGAAGLLALKAKAADAPPRLGALAGLRAATSDTGGSGDTAVRPQASRMKRRLDALDARIAACEAMNQRGMRLIRQVAEITDKIRGLEFEGAKPSAARRKTFAKKRG